MLWAKCPNKAQREPIVSSIAMDKHALWQRKPSVNQMCSAEQGELDLRATSDDLHDTAWHSHGVQPCDITSIQYFPEDHHDMMYEDSEPMSHGLASKPPLAIAIGKVLPAQNMTLRPVCDGAVLSSHA